MTSTPTVADAAAPATGAGNPAADKPRGLDRALLIFSIVLALPALVAVIAALLTVIPSIDPRTKSDLDLVWKIASAFALAAGTVLGWFVKHRADSNITRLQGELGRTAKRDEIAAQFVTAAELKEIQADLDERVDFSRARREKLLESLQERHRKKLDALDLVSGQVSQFNHAVKHLRDGDLRYLEPTLKHYRTARETARLHESLLGSDFNDAVHRFTEAGMGRATITVEPQTVDALERKGIPKAVLAHVRRLVGHSASLLWCQEELLSGLADELRARHSRDVLTHCTIRDTYDAAEYEAASNSFERLKRESLARLPVD